MIIVIDTSSLLSLVRYYLPFDKDGILFAIIERKIRNGEIIVIDKVGEECKYISKGIILDSIPVLRDKKILTKTDLILPSKKFFTQLEHNFVNGVIRNKLTVAEFELEKGKFLNSADGRLILFCKNSNNSDVVLVSEETTISNDNKTFHKIPTLCKILNLRFMTLPQVLKFIPDLEVIYA